MIPEFLTVIEISLPAYFRLRHGQQVKIEDSEIRTGPSSQYGRSRWRGHWVWLRGFRAVCDLLCRHLAAGLLCPPLHLHRRAGRFLRLQLLREGFGREDCQPDQRAVQEDSPSPLPPLRHPLLALRHQSDQHLEVVIVSR